MWRRVKVQGGYIQFGRSLVRGLSEAQETMKEEQSLGMKDGVMLYGGTKGGSSIWQLESWISSWVRVRWRLEVSSMMMMKVMEDGLN
ncbi:hypothetical protein V6N13_089744 [Hibiscus sabdariffa]